ncbi:MULTISPECIES: rRNA maturation RNase YbeY [unclassified Brevundimonas]|uniref:rRNA maturation RNase YbeY n=1 Tax=unclassified Brevundimonas TaxID=2622653 RepID=UPI002006865E|nr:MULTISPECIES: rRNA maturation RNase YbeY [unclassified Brevundimonas]MCK6104923.1 rRNA maturation RNase YbeY [Brevundimonas sp. EYE_349]
MIEIEVEADDWSAALPEVEAVVERAATAALGTVQGDVVVLLTDNETVRDLNARFRDKDKPTNVLSFPAPELPELLGAAPHLGDIVLAYGVCADEAVAQKKTLPDHLSHLVVHGVLHLLGRDHEDEAEAEEMEAEEREILAGIGVADPYAAEQD